jgi:hypothetical protein
VTCPLGHPTDVTDRLAGLEGIKVHRCKYCRKFTVEGSNQWVDGGSGIVDRLKALSGYQPVKDIVDEWQHMQQSDIRDPMWTQVGWEGGLE